MGSVDTGARERLRAYAQEIVDGTYSGEGADKWKARAEVLAAGVLASGVGVPPPTCPDCAHLLTDHILVDGRRMCVHRDWNFAACRCAGVGAPPDEANPGLEANSADYAEIRARAEHALTAWGEPYRGDGNLRTFTEALARDIVALAKELERLAGVGVARPPEPHPPNWPDSHDPSGPPSIDELLGSAPARERQDARARAERLLDVTALAQNFFAPGADVVALAHDFIALHDEMGQRDELTCDRCGNWHGVCWHAPSDVWNAVMREGDRGKSDEFGFCCPVCFMQLADERGIGSGIWRIAPEVLASEASAHLPRSGSALPEQPCESCGRLREQLDAARQRTKNAETRGFEYAAMGDELEASVSALTGALAEARILIHDAETFIDVNGHTRDPEDESCEACGLIARLRKFMAARAALVVVGQPPPTETSLGDDRSAVVRKGVKP